jgi:ATP-dependent exoDNAse (exonuclease V) alpha subunit
LGYAGTLHAAQGITIGNSTTAGVCWTILSDRASRAMAYVGMTRGRDENHLAIYPAVINEAHQHHPGDDAASTRSTAAPNTPPPTPCAPS